MQETAERKRNQENQAQREELARLRAMMARRTGEVPDALCCPISMEIMRDPVIAADGHTYERAEIEAWFANNRTSPTVWKSTSASGARCRAGSVQR